MRIIERSRRAAGGPVRLRAVLLFACVLALESADLATIGAAAPQLQHALHISNAQLGLLPAISLFVGAVATVPVGALADRVTRKRLLAIAVGLWAVAMLGGATAQGYDWLLISRVGLGAVTAAAGPVIASMIGDFFAAEERARIYGYVYSGELLGAGIGFVVSGGVASALGWRWAFAVLILPAVLLAVYIWRSLPEPARGRQSRLEQRARRGRRPQGVARRAVTEQRVAPERRRVLREDPERMPLRRAVAYVLRIPTNLWLIAASSIGYFFFAGMRTFGLVFVRGHFSLAQGAATAVLFFGGLGSLAGVLLSGRLADRMIRGGRIDARIVVGGVSYVAAAVFLLPTLLVQTVAIGLPLLILVGAALAGPNPPLDAARLDIMPSRLWGRAEGVRTFVRQSAQAVAPLAFGILADALGASTNAAGNQRVTPAGTHGLELAFLIMLGPLLLNGLMLLAARRSYATDVATAVASERAPVSGQAPTRARARQRLQAAG